MCCVFGLFEFGLFVFGVGGLLVCLICSYWLVSLLVVLATIIWFVFMLLHDCCGYLCCVLFG